MKSEIEKHTPGPWQRNIRSKGKYPVVFAGRNQHVATVSQQENPDETEANVDLVAAAPELLSALQGCMDVIINTGHCQATGTRDEQWFNRAYQKACVALAKATDGK